MSTKSNKKEIRKENSLNNIHDYIRKLAEKGKTVNIDEKRALKTIAAISGTTTKTVKNVMNAIEEYEEFVDKTVAGIIDENITNYNGEKETEDGKKPKTVEDVAKIYRAVNRNGRVHFRKSLPY